MSLFQWCVATRRRLGVGVALGWGIFGGAAVPLADYVREASTSATTNLLLITLWVAALAAASLLSAVLVADLAFPHRWRERVLLGRAVEAAPGEDADALAASALKNRRLPFYVLFLGLLGLGAWGVDRLLGGFFGEYSRIGFARTVMRSDNTAFKLELIDERALERRESYLRDGLRLLRDHVWRDAAQPPEVRARAVRALAALMASLWDAVDDARQKGLVDRWEEPLVLESLASLSAEWRAALAEGGPVSAPEIALALGHLRDRSALPQLREIAARESVDGPLWHAAVLALGLVHERESLAPLVALVARARTAAPSLATLSWAVREQCLNYGTIGQDAPPPAFDALLAAFGPMAAEGGLAERCLAIEILGVTGDARVAAPLFAAFEGAQSEARCAEWRVDLHLPADRQVLAEGPLWFRVLDALRTISIHNDDVIAWLEARSAETARSEAQRSSLKSLLESSRRRRP